MWISECTVQGLKKKYQFCFRVLDILWCKTQFCFTTRFNQTLYSALFAFLLPFRHLFLSFFLFFTFSAFKVFFLFITAFLRLFCFFFRCFFSLSLPLFSYIFPYIRLLLIWFLFLFFILSHSFCNLLYSLVARLCLFVLSFHRLFSSALLSTGNGISHSILNDVFSWY